MTRFLLAILLLGPVQAFARQEIRGRVTDNHERPLPGANVTLAGSFDGATSDSLGQFRFSTSETGKQRLVVSLLGYRSDTLALDLSGGQQHLDIRLQKEINKLNAVTISAGSFSISDQAHNTVLTPMDIVTIAGAGADPMNALRTLPGAQQVPNQTGLFIQGGTGEETKAFIDGMMVLHPFYSNSPDIGARARFNPFLFKGTVFSSGGYSAQYGGAMSAAVILDSRDLPERSSGTVGISSVGLSGALDHLSANGKSSYGASLSYANLWPYFQLINQHQDYTVSPYDLNGDMNFRIKTSPTGMLKFYGYGDANKLQFSTPAVGDPHTRELFHLKNRNAYTNVTYRESFGARKDWLLYLGGSYNTNTDRIRTGTAADASLPDLDTIKVLTQMSEGKVMLTHPIGPLSELRGGMSYAYETDHTVFNGDALGLQDNYAGAFLEADLYLTPKFVARLGARGEHSSLLDRDNLAPRASLSYRLGEATQVSAAFGHFYEKPENRYLLGKQDLDFQRARHYILSVQHLRPDYTWRVELFDKAYTGLLKTVPDTANLGEGYARGVQVFWRDRKTIPNGDYWISYSYLDTKRDYLDYPRQVRPPFASAHTLNVVYKQLIPAIATNLSATYTFASGKPYENPNRSREEFLSDRTPPLHTLALSAAYLLQGKKTFTVLVCSVSNVLGSDQVYGYRYSADGSSRAAITAPARRFFFLGAFISFGIDRSQEVIDNM